IALFPKLYIRLTGKLAKFMGRFKFIKDPEHIVESWTIQVTQFTKEAKTLSQDKRRIILCTLINVVRLTLLYSLPYAIAWALHISIPINKLLDVIALSSFVIIANSFIPIPGASGGTEVVFTLLFRGLMGSLTGAVMILWRFSTYHVVVLIGAIIFIIMRNYYDRQTKKEVS
ncbi:MAG: YbhN family protein, partial [Absicoccus sp.]